MTLKIGMISFAHMHAASYLHKLSQRSDVEIVGIADEDRQRVAPFLEQYQLPYFENHMDLLAVEGLDAVVICSENVRHAELTLAAAAAGKHILCEKPLGVSEAEMEQMILTCREHGVQLMTAFPCRYIPAVMEAKAAVDRGDIGEIVAIKGTNRGTMPDGWFIDKARSGGGAVFDHTVHVMDLMHWFTGAKAAEVYAFADTMFHEVDIDDAGLVHVTFDNGVIAVLDPSWSRPASFPTWGDVTMEVIGTEGVLHIDSFAQKNELFSNTKGSQWQYFGDDMDGGLVSGFVEAIREGKSVPILGEDGFYSARVALAAYDSAASGQPVKLEKSSL